MIPYIHVPDIGPLHPFGLLVATGVLIGSWLAMRRARNNGFDLEKLNSFITWMLVVGFIGGHVLDEIFYHPSEIMKRPWSLLMLWEGLSSFGGFIGALIGIVLWKYFYFVSWFPGHPLFSFVGSIKRRKKTESIFAFADLILSVFPVAWVFGRSGCSVVHDHPGARAKPGAFLSVMYGNGPKTDWGPFELIHGTTPRYDLGFLELCFTIILASLLALTWRKKVPTGTYVAATALAYAPVRFAMDFLRIQPSEGESADPRYGGLTPAQWSCVALFMFGIAVIMYMIRLNRSGIDPANSVMAKPEEDDDEGEDEAEPA